MNSLALIMTSLASASLSDESAIYLMWILIAGAAVYFIVRPIIKRISWLIEK